MSRINYSDKRIYKSFLFFTLFMIGTNIYIKFLLNFLKEIDQIYISLSIVFLLGFLISASFYNLYKIFNKNTIMAVLQSFNFLTGFPSAIAFSIDFKDAIWKMVNMFFVMVCLEIFYSVYKEIIYKDNKIIDCDNELDIKDSELINLSKEEDKK